MLILFSPVTGNCAHVDSVSEAVSTCSIYESLSSLLSSAAPLSTHALKATPARYEPLTLFAASKLEGDWDLYLVENGAIAPPPPDLPAAATPLADWVAFYDAILITAAFQSIRSQALTSLPLTLALVEFSAAIGDAKAGRANLPAIGAAVTNVLSAATLTAGDRAELHSAGSGAALPDLLLDALTP